MGTISISVSTLLILLCAVVVAAVLIALLIGTRRYGTTGENAIKFIRTSTILVIVGLVALVALVALMFLGNAPVKQEPNADTIMQTPDVTPTAAPQPTQVVITPPLGMSQDILDELMRHCNDIMYYSNKYCGTSYIVEPTPYYPLEDASTQLLAFCERENLQGNLYILASSKFLDVYIALPWVNEEEPPSDYLVECFHTALQGFEDYFQTELIEMPPNVKNDVVNVTNPPDDSQQLQGDYLSGKRYTADGYYTGDMYTLGQAFYFEDGKVYASAEGSSAESAKDDSGLYSPVDMSYSLDGSTITISGGGTTSQWIYDASRDVIIAGGTELHRSY